MDEQLIRTSLHEAGHLIVGRKLGRQGHLFLWRASLTSPWAGRVRFDDPVEGWSADDRIIVAFAGVIAEAVIDPADQMTPEVVFNEAHHQRTVGGIQFLSEADFELAAGFERRHVGMAFDIVRRYAPEIVDAATEAREFSLAYAGDCGRAPT